METKEQLLRIERHLAESDQHLAIYNEQLKLHIYRTKLAEDNIADIRKNEAEVKAHVNRVEGAFKFLGLISLITAVVAGIKALF